MTRQKLVRAVIAGALGTVGTMALVVVLRSLQHLEPAADPGPMIFIGIPAGIAFFAWGLGLYHPGMLLASGEPGIARAATNGLLGFLIGALLVIITRGLQNLDPIWDPQVGMVFIALFTSGFFMWGIGAFDPKMSVHGETPEAAHHEHEEEAEPSPGMMLSTDLWRVAFLSLVLLVVLFAVATIPSGPALRTVGDAEGDAAAVGFMPVQLPFGGPEIMVSELVFFVGFIIFTFISLAVAAGIIGLAMYFLSRGVTETKGEPSTADLTPPPPVQLVSRIAAGVANWLRSGLPKLLGQK